VPLFKKSAADHPVLYKPAGQTLGEMRVKSGQHPKKLYILKKDQLQALKEAQSALNKQLQKDIATNNPQKVRSTVARIAQETLRDPRSGSLEGAASTVGILVSEYTKESDVIRNLMDLSSNDYTTVTHSINVMALSLAYGIFIGLSPPRKKILGLSALLHDVGKMKVDPEILKAERKLSDEEYLHVQSHTTLGYNILNGCQFTNVEIKFAALEHHEKIDGSGYPHGTQHMHVSAEIIGLIDYYEALTNDDRPYRSALAPLQALELLKADVEAGKFRQQLFANFAYSLVKAYQQ
jgi:HD-GYP domain-containing protein (c-di-GMP phosphodiesterase class II)